MSEVTQHAISRFPVPELADMPEDIRDRILAVQEKAGFVPNVFLVLAHRPEEFRAFFAYHDALMEKPGNLSIAEREMIVVATSNLNQCLPNNPPPQKTRGNSLGSPSLSLTQEIGPATGK